MNFAPKGQLFEINMESLFAQIPLDFPFLEGGPDRLDRAAAFEKTTRDGDLVMSHKPKRITSRSPRLTLEFLAPPQ